MRNFVQNYKKIVDSDLTGIIIAVIVGACITFIENRGKAKKTRKAPQQKPVQRRPRATAPARNRVPSAAAQQHTHAAPEKKPVAPEPFISGEEGRRSTADKPAAHRPAKVPSRGLRPLDRDGLRNAVIWGEILRPKF